jgi:sugar-specific transcriptional regulator TrmB
MDPVESLKGLGLTQYEAAVYVALLGSGPLEARETAQRADVPTGRIYDALHALADRGMVDVLQGRPKRFRAVEPSVALDDLLSEKRVELDRRFDEMTRQAASLERELAPRAREQDKPAFNVSLGEETGRAFLSTQLARARETVDISMRVDFTLEPEDVEVFRALAKAVDRGVRVRAVLPADELDRALESPLAGEVLDLLGPHLGEGLRVRLTDQEEVVPFTVIDGDGVTLGVKNPVEPSRYFAFLFVHDPPFAEDLTQRFEGLWEAAQPGVAASLDAAAEQAGSFEP